MQKHSLWAVPDSRLAGHHDGAASGNGGNPPAPGPPVLTVAPGGRSIENVVSTLATMPVDLARLVHGKTDDDLRRPAQDGGWGLVEILPHLRDWEVILADYVDQILSGDAPAIQEYDDSLWAIEHDYRDQDPREALAEFGERREALVERLRTLEPDEWNRIGIMARQGRVTLHWLLDLFCDHDAKHLLQARDVLA